MHLYQNFVEKISQRFMARFDEIDPQWNFDIGTEFEITLATLISEILPNKYGVCRGFVTPKVGTPKGDDIIIYDQMSVPLIRPETGYQFTRKENVPLDATYAYIEAKNTVELVDNKKKTFIKKAIQQTQAVKTLDRADRPLKRISDFVNLGRDLKIESGKGLPKIRNPMLTVVFARGARINGTLEKDPEKIIDSLVNPDIWKNAPDLLVIGNDLLIIPIFTDSEDGTKSYKSPFLVEDCTLTIFRARGLAYGVGVVSILNALQNITLELMPWSNVISDALNFNT